MFIPVNSKGNQLEKLPTSLNSELFDLTQTEWVSK